MTPNPADESAIRNWAAGRATPHRITLRVPAAPGAETAPGAEALRAFCAILTERAPRIAVLEAPAEKRDTLPAIRFGPGVAYSAVPSGPELPLFLDALSGMFPPLSDDAAASLATMRRPAVLRIYISNHCVFCPRVVRDLLAIANACEEVGLEVVDAALFPDAAKRDKIRSVPTLLLDDRFRWTGAVAAGEIAAVLSSRDPGRLSAASLEQMLKQGDAAALAQRMADRNRIFPAFYDLLRHAKWSVRLGAIVASESLAEQSPPLAADLVAALTASLPQTPAAAAGDVIYLIGEIGDETALPALRSLLTPDLTPDLTAEIREAALEAIDTISDKTAERHSTRSQEEAQR